MQFSQHPMFDFYFFEKFEVDKEQVKLFSDNWDKSFLLLCKDDTKKLRMTSELNTEWIMRAYNAAKMIMTATLMLNSAEYCMRKNIMVSVPYLLYYAAFSSARGFLYVSPFPQTKNFDELSRFSHKKVLNLTSDLIKNSFDTELGKRVKSLMLYLRSQRELFSYKFPASGICKSIKFDDTVDICGLLSELTELGSYRIQEIFDKEFLKYDQRLLAPLPSWCNVDKNMLQKIYVYDVVEENGEEERFFDSEDCYRTGYIERKIFFPKSVLFTMTEGMTEDFFGAWRKSLEDNDSGSFDPDNNLNRIFPIP